MKRIESACLMQTMLFDSMEELDLFKKQMEKKRVPYRVDGVERVENGMVSVRLCRRYVHYPVGDYLGEEVR